MSKHYVYTTIKTPTQVMVQRLITVRDNYGVEKTNLHVKIIDLTSFHHCLKFDETYKQFLWLT